MVNIVRVIWSLVSWAMKMAGVMKPCTVEIEPGTVMRFWVPSQTISKSTKPVVVLLHLFCADGLTNWVFQIISLSKNYDVYVPDLIFFGGSITDKPDRSPTFQAVCLATGLKKLGVEKCAVVGVSYGGMVAFKMAELYSELVQAVVISGSVLAIEECMISSSVEEIGFSSSSEMLLPSSNEGLRTLLSGSVLAIEECMVSSLVKKFGFSSCSEMLLPSSNEGLRTLLSVCAYKNIQFPNRMFNDFLKLLKGLEKVMFSNRKEKSELLEALAISYKDIHIPKFSQPIHLLWGGEDIIFKPEVAHKIKERLGNNATIEIIKKAGHMVNVERPCIYNRCLKKFLSSVMIDQRKLS